MNSALASEAPFELPLYRNRGKDSDDTIGSFSFGVSQNPSLQMDIRSGDHAQPPRDTFSDGGGHSFADQIAAQKVSAN